jgi:glycosyltransferase involved in cell wall biosynthesis
MKVLHLFSNSKWTGPAEPALNLCVALRAQGVEADFACAPGAGQSINKVVETARDRGIEPVLAMHLGKHRNPLRNFADRRTLGRILDAGGYGLVHSHLDNDHDIAAGPCTKRGIPLVRSNYHGDGLPPGKRSARLLAHTAALIEPSEIARQTDLRRFGFPEARSFVVPGAIDTERFDPARETPDGRRRLNLPNDAFVLGIVARMQTHRRYEDLFEAMKRLADEYPKAHLVVVGRGSKQEQVAYEPVRRLGLEGRVHFAGFIEGEDYVGMLKAFDAGVYLVPGSDGTCRTVRELMAMGKPVIAADRGMLREIVTDGRNGLIVNGDAESLHAAFHQLAQDRPHRAEMGRAAREKAVESYSLEAQAKAVMRVYEGM